MTSKKTILKKVKCFLSELAKDASSYANVADMNKSPYWFFQQGEGGVFLPSATYKEFVQIRNELMDSFSHADDLSRSAVESVLREAIFEVLDIQKQRDPNLPVRLDGAMERLCTFLERRPQDYECWAEVGGLDNTSLPGSFGSVRFNIFDTDQIQKIKKIIQTKHTRDRTDELEYIEDELKKSLLGRPTAVVKVTAFDAKAAIALAERRIRATVECLNFFSDMIPYNDGWIFLPTKQEMPGSNSMRLAVADDGSIKASGSDDEPVGRFSFAALRERTEGMVTVAVNRVDSLLTEQRDKVEELILTAVRWAGRATVAKTREESFLLFAIALECLVLPTQSDELTYRLSQRVARLLGEDVDTRVKLAKRTKELYGIRSKVVHSGHYEVTEVECNEVRTIAKNVILKLLTNSNVEQCRKPKELHEYFEKLTLK